MAAFNVVDVNGIVVQVPDYGKVELQGLVLGGDLSYDWNEPIQQNLVKVSNSTIINARGITALDGRVTANESSIGSLTSTMATKADKTYVDTELTKKQDTLTAGTNITIENGVISANDTSIAWTEVTGKPSTFAPDVHNHDSLYVKVSDMVDADISALIV